MLQQPPIGGAEHFGAEAWEKLLFFSTLLVSEGQIRGLIGPREEDKLWDRHLLNSVPIAERIVEDATVADIGSGAGFPGIVVAIIRPDAQISLIETMQKRADWLNFVAGELGLENVSVFRDRAEKIINFPQQDVVTARAVAPLKKLVPWSFPLLKNGGSLLALKGQKAEQEIIAAKKQLKQVGALWADIYDVSVWGSDDSTRVVEVKKK